VRRAPALAVVKCLLTKLSTAAAGTRVRRPTLTIGS
jgi:hypothetical protein